MARSAFVSRSFAALVAVVALLGGSPAHAGDDTDASLDARVARLAEQASLQGNLLVVRGGEIVHEWSLGVARASTGEPVTPATRFEVGSVAKPLTAIGVLILVDRGLVVLDAPVTEYLPSFPYPAVTVRQLLLHTSGMPWHADFIAEYWDRSRVSTHTACLEILARERPELAFEPGTGYLYSNLNYWALAAIVERVSGRPFAGFMQDEVFIPLGMERTSVLGDPLSSESAPPGVAVAQVLDEQGGWVESGTTEQTRFVHFLAGELGSVHVTTTARDLVKLLPVLRGEALLSPPTAREMLTPGRFSDGRLIEVQSWTSFGYGLGWKLDADGTAWHDGDWGGYRAMVRLDPASGDGLVYTFNRPPTDWGWLGKFEGLLGE